jgi:hypothetical protein
VMPCRRGTLDVVLCAVLTTSPVMELVDAGPSRCTKAAGTRWPQSGDVSELGGAAAVASVKKATSTGLPHHCAQVSRRGDRPWLRSCPPRVDAVDRERLRRGCDLLSSVGLTSPCRVSGCDRPARLAAAAAEVPPPNAAAHPCRQV